MVLLADVDPAGTGIGFRSVARALPDARFAGNLIPAAAPSRRPAPLAAARRDCPQVHLW
jgi:hypothetical protein